MNVQKWYLHNPFWMLYFGFCAECLKALWTHIFPFEIRHLFFRNAYLSSCLIYSFSSFIKCFFLKRHQKTKRSGLKGSSYSADPCGPLRTPADPADPWRTPIFSSNLRTPQLISKSCCQAVTMLLSNSLFVVEKIMGSATTE